MSTHESRGSETIVGRAPLAGMCSTIIVSVLTVPPSFWVLSALSSAGVAPARLSLPMSRMFWSAPSGSVCPAASAGTGEPWGTWAVKLRYEAHAMPLAIMTTKDMAAATTRSRCLFRDEMGGNGARRASSSENPSTTFRG